MNTSIWSFCYMKKPPSTPLLSPEEIEALLSSSTLYEWNSVFVLDNDTRHFRSDFPNENYMERSQRIRSAYLMGSTVIVQNLEKFSVKLRDYSLKFSADTTVHMYLTPPGGSPSFDFHTDDTDVYAMVIIGEKIFEIKNKDGSITTKKLSAGEGISLPQGTLHRASSSGATCLLSFGYTPLQDYPVIPAVRAEDFY